MTISITTLVGSFEYPPKTVGYLLKQKWIAANIDGNVTPTWNLPADTDTSDPWYNGEPPEILTRAVGSFRDKNIDLGDGLFRVEFDVAIYVFAVNQRQEFQIQSEIRRILKEWRRLPILKYSEQTPGDSGLHYIYPPGITFKPAEDANELLDVSSTQSSGIVTCVWFEHRT